MKMTKRVKTSLLLSALLVIQVCAQQQTNVRNDTFQQTCELPSFEWAAYGTRVSGRMYTRRAALLGDHVFAAGYLKSTNAPNNENFLDVDNDFGVSGPYTKADPTGASSFKAEADLISYTTEFGSFAQYEVGVVKIDRVTGRPNDIYVYYGEGQDETCGLAAKEIGNGDKLLAISGHYVGSLTADHANGTNTTIYNSNAEGTEDFVLHPNAIKNGFDDGFVISANADTGHANWLVSYPTSTKDSQTVGVDIDADGNVYGAGYACNDNGSVIVCDGFVAKFAASDGTIVWEQWFTDLGAAMWLVYDDTDDALYVTGTTSYNGDEENAKLHNSCNHAVCAVTMRLNASSGSVDWVRTLEGSPRWNFFDQSGDIRLANANDGPYIYVALDDAGENGKVSLDEGTPYAGCLDEKGQLTPEYLVHDSKVVIEADCASGTTFISRNDSKAFPAADASSDVFCGMGHDAVDACVIKYHKFTGLPVWASDLPPIASIVPSADGKSVMVVGFYYPSWGHFDSVLLPDYNGVEGAYNAKLSSATGFGEYVMHSGGISKDRPYDAVGSPEGDIYIVGYTQSQTIDWGGTLITKIDEEGVDQNDDVGTAFQMGRVSSKTSEYQFFTVKLATSEPPSSLSCVESCSLEGNVANPIIKADTCLIDNRCYVSGATAEMFGRSCLVCDPSVSQKEWSFGPTLGVQQCFIDNICRDEGEMLMYRESRRVTHESVCQSCQPKKDFMNYSVEPGYILVEDVNPPHDCALAFSDAPTFSTTLPPVAATQESMKVTDSPTKSPDISSPTKLPDVTEENTIAEDEGLGSVASSSNGNDIGEGVSELAIVGIVIGSGFIIVALFGIWKIFSKKKPESITLDELEFNNNS